MRKVLSPSQRRKVDQNMGRRFFGMFVTLATLATAAVLSPAASPSSPLQPLVRLLGTTGDAAVQADVLRGMSEGRAGRRVVAMPVGWPAVYRKLAGSSNAEVRDRALHLSLLFGDEQAFAALHRTLTDPAAAPAARHSALQSLL